MNLDYHPAAYAQDLGDGKVRCLLCPNHCLMTPGKRGICLTRQNISGRLVSTNYCRPVSVAIDPIEKKPLYHFYPGSQILSTGPNGCTLKCVFCQNCDISQTILPTRAVPPKRIAEQVAESGTIGIAYTYSEPYIWYETIMDVGRDVRERGLVNVMVTNGYMEGEPLRDLLSVVNAMNIDIKSMSPAFYRRLCKGRLEPVLRACEQVKNAGCHLEITNLVIPGENDSDDDIHGLAEFIAVTLGRDTPLHLSRYFPRHRMQHDPTPERTLVRAYEIARERLDYVYVGNVAAGERANTRCRSCGVTLVERAGHAITLTENLCRGETGLGVCGACGTASNIRMASAG